MNLFWCKSAMTKSCRRAVRCQIAFLQKKVAAIDSIAEAVQVNRPYQFPLDSESVGGCTDDWIPTSLTKEDVSRLITEVV